MQATPDGGASEEIRGQIRDVGIAEPLDIKAVCVCVSRDRPWS
jgi:hypothetical protein